MASSSGKPSWVRFILSCITHIILLAPAVYVVILAAQRNYSLFNWHPPCLTVGCGLLMAEAVFAVSGDALISSRVSRVGRIKLHWILHIIGLSLLVIGFGTVVANKIRSNAYHFTSDHGKVGLTSFILSIIVALGGVMTLYSGLLQGVSLATKKLIHGCCGTITIIFLLASLITGLYRGWWPGSDVGRGLCVGAYVVGGCLILINPLITSLRRIRGI